ncbi:PAS domain S-box protein [Alkaliphilus pronyensis]|uniref:histidine kinase n=1 Tax=Alkaliphilus pronyensis TaxID=1482732 RepID=A0A6I0F7Y6_9FIRM|nr:ATP-binding protein [Alkaliphilus pronyensis]KAB3530490.1 PAS domain S-box protein [Alkaliphilus pronyensis]
MQWDFLQDKGDNIYRKIILFFLLSPVAIVLSMKNYTMFYFVIEFIYLVISLLIFFTIINFYNKSTENYLAFFGIVIASIIGLQILSLITHEGVYIFQSQLNINQSLLMTTKRLLMAIGKLTMLLIYNYKKHLYVVIIYSVLFFIISTFLINGEAISTNIDNLTIINTASVIIILVLITSLLLLAKGKKHFLDYTYIYIGISIYASTFSEVFYVLSNNQSNSFKIFAYLLQLAALYLIGNAIIKVSLNDSFLQGSNHLVEKLSTVNKKLEKEVVTRKQSERELQNSKNKYQKLITLLPDAVFIHNANKFFYTNYKGAELLGLKAPEDIANMEILDFIDQEYRQKFKENIGNVFTYNSITSLGKLKLVRIDKKIVDVEFAAMSIFELDEGLILSVVRDITHRKRAKDLERQIETAIEYDKVKTEFFANISHEMKTPINLIYSTIQLLELDDNMSVANNKKIKILKQNCNRITRLVDNIIDITKLDSNYFHLQLYNTDIIGLIRSITLSVKEHIKDKSIKVNFFANRQEKIMTLDPNAVERIVLNLLSNAVKFSNKQDEITVIVNDNGENIEIIIKDTGIGIPKDKLDIIFDRFTQVDKSLTRNHEGSGIGLSIVKSLVELHGGTIKVNSTLNQGTEFVISVPVKFYEEEDIVYKEYNIDRSVEKIKVEFSDIYSLGA